MRKQLNVAVYIYEISNRFKWLEQVKNEWPIIYEAMFLLKGENKQNKALNKLIEKLNKFKESVLSLNLIENLNEFEINLHKLLKELIYVVEGIWDGRHNYHVDLEEIKIVRKQLNYKMIMKIFYEKNEGIEEDRNNSGGNGNSKIVQLIFGAETYAEIFNYNTEFEAFSVDWNKFKEQRFIGLLFLKNIKLIYYNIFLCCGI
ncbi:unnamed protein product [Meloidogyne enterolobii]|uniref:Uncharacterized protein n=1 Tax=Meloidogyne enterolobii TaxID=390850 RepID=A0ACB0YAM6_MELEN